jgi:hypothetical protein
MIALAYAGLIGWLKAWGGPGRLGVTAGTGTAGRDGGPEGVMDGPIAGPIVEVSVLEEWIRD